MFTPAQYQILAAISRAGTMSRTGLAGVTGLSKASISILTKELIGRGILGERELVFGQGRPSVLLGLEADAACFVGISLQADPTILLLTDLHGATLARMELPRRRDHEHCLAELVEALPALVSRAGRPVGPISGIGVALPGFVSRDRTTCLYSTALGWSNVDIVGHLATLCDIPAYIENDANALILGEHLFGIMRDCPDFSMVAVGDGIGCAHIVDGRLHRGHNGGAGEISHAPVVLDGGAIGAMPCRCGKRGCLETVATLQAIRAAARQAGLPCDIAELAQMAQTGRPEALAILHRAASALGIAIAQLIQMFDPSHVVIMLDTALKGEVFGAMVQQTVEAHVMRRPDGQATLYLRDAQKDGFASGAASLAAQKFLFGLDR
ncbi:MULTISPECIES: ROK family transcriptional regulator [Nguyenibacter]|uniref:ROK family transcriptional regulator n=1 Tax=Nguyenibacter vanlangensis TaxID=1216886 RepID=A0A7Y7IV92_9PROT|nr:MULTISPECIES: ROK family transcriptional regulator [Nguyenibacter]NVN10708.1 ROK family transcriptional regulator [Nguyenibacter vanlangensis]WRH86763.1 ROK family transcriptional regulator [Nguyenibacter sp. L1]